MLVKWQHWGRCWPNDGHCPCTPCGWSSTWWGSHPSSSFSSCHLTSPLSPCGTCGGGMSCPLQFGIVCEAGWALEPWESVLGALESFFLGVALVELPWLLSPPPPLLGLLSEPAVGFLAMNLMPTFLWLCRAEDDTKACFKHFPHP